MYLGKRFFSILIVGVLLCFTLSSCFVLRRGDCPCRYTIDRASSALHNHVLTHPEINDVPKMAGGVIYLVNQETALHHAEHTK